MNRISSSLLFSFFLLTIHLWNVEGKANCAQMSCGTGSCCNDFKLGGVCYNQLQYGCLKDNNANLVLCAKGAGACNGVCFDAKNYHCNGNALAQGPAPTQAKTSEAVKTSAKTSTSAVKTSTSQVKSSTSAIKTSEAVKTSTSAIKTSEAVKTSSVIVNPIPVPTNNRPYQTADLRIINSCKYTLWFEGRYGGKGAPIPGHSNTSTRALPGGYVDFTIPATGLSGTRFWAKYGCDGNGKNCKIGDQMQYYPEGGCPPTGCTAPIDSLFEATFGCKAGSSCANSNPTTWFDTSQVDGYTIPYKVTLNGEKNKCDCTSKGCGLDYIDASRLDLSKCPSGENLTGRNAVTSAKGKSLTSVDLRLIDKSTNTILGCLSPCKKMTWEWGLNEGTIPSLYYCCPTPNPANCQIGNGCISSAGCRAGPVEDTTYVKSIHDMAPGIYTYAYDDGVGLHACPAGTVTYTMEYCPAGSSAYPHPL